MEEERKAGNSCLKSTSSTASPTLNLMEQLLLAKMEKHSFRGADGEGESHGARRTLALKRTDSMDSQTSTSTYNSLFSTDSASGSNFCKCDDCLLGIVDKPRRTPPPIGRTKVKPSSS